MPVLTRSQCLKMNATESPIINIKTTNVHKVRPDPNNLLPWFISITKEGIARADEMNRKKGEITYYKTIYGDTYMESEYRTIQFDLIRSITETFYIINEYLPLVVKQTKKVLTNFIKVVYNKVQQFYIDMRTNRIKPQSEYEFQVVAGLINTLQDVEKMVIPLLPPDMELKRIRMYVDYTGMADDQCDDSDSDYEEPVENQRVKEFYANKYYDDQAYADQYEDYEEHEYYEQDHYDDNNDYEREEEDYYDYNYNSDQEPIKRPQLSQKNPVVKIGQHTWFH